MLIFRSQNAKNSALMVEHFLFIGKEIGKCSKKLLSQERKTDAYTLRMCNIYKMPQKC